MRRSFSLMLLLLLGATTQVIAENNDTIFGNASYYSDKFHGRKMSNGEIYHRDSMTCAHLKFPFGTMLKVKNPMNGKEVVVRVTDRGPFTKRFLIDLSRAAAKKLDLIHRGFAMVEITPFTPQEVPYKLKEELPEIPELNIEYSPIAIYPDPAWRDSVIIAVQKSTEKFSTEKKQKDSSPKRRIKEKIQKGQTTQTTNPCPANTGRMENNGKSEN